MPFREVVGFDLHDARLRRNLKVLFYNRRFQGTGQNTVLLMLRGSARFQFDEGAIAARPSQVLCFESEKLKTAQGDPDQPPSYVMAAFDLWGRGGRALPVSSLGWPRSWKSRKPGTLGAVMKKLTALTRTKRGGPGTEGAKWGFKLLDTLALDARPGTPFAAAEERRIDDRIAAVLEQMRVHYKRRFSVSELARIARLHPIYFSRIFKRATGMPPHRYHLHLKIEKAKVGLSQSAEPLLVTGEELGFSDYSHFFRTFRKISGVTPWKFRHESKP